MLSVEQQEKAIPRANERRADRPEARFHLAAIIDSAEDAIISKDLNGIVSSWNSGAERIFGYTEDDMIGDSILRLIPAGLHHEEEEILQKLRKGERLEHYETVRLNKQGIEIEVSITVSPIRDETGTIIGASKIVRNISDRKRIEHLLIQAEKLAVTGRMAASIAHEINNPLESLMNLVYLARQNTPEASVAHKYLITAEGELERLTHIARQTLGFYRETGRYFDVQLHELIETVLSVYQAKIISSGITLDCVFAKVPDIGVSRGEVIQIFSNVIGNAIDAMRTTGGTLHISVHPGKDQSSDGIEAVIRDEGTGIAPDLLDKVFEPFYTTKGDLGTGIGLWMTKQLVEKRSGHIQLVSDTNGRKAGTSVTIFLPFSAPS
jgi:PAS domain S-box-containing protein